MTTTTVHVEVGVLDRIIEIGAHQSTYIREAIKEKLVRDEGFLSAIDVQGALVDSLLKQTEEEQAKLHEIHEKHKEWKKQQEVSLVKDAVMTEYITGNHTTKESLRSAVFPGLLKEFKETVDINEIVEEVWEEVQIERSQH